MQAAMEAKYAVESFLTDEADLLDRWKLDEWLGLFEEDCTYQVGPLGIDDPEAASPDDTLFLVADDHWRLTRRVEMLQNPSAHVEWPHSKTRHMVANVKVLDQSDDAIEAQSNLVVFRTKRGVSTQYMAHVRYSFSRMRDGALKIRSKRVMLDLDGLTPQGKVSIIL